MRDHTATTASIDARRARSAIQRQLAGLEAARVYLADAMSSAQILAEEEGRPDELHHLSLASIGADRTLREFLRLAAALVTAPPDGDTPSAVQEAPR